jgi:GNAT superfamily N-acetyltransferase
LSAKEHALPSNLSIEEEAARAFVRLESTTDPAERDMIRRWISADPRHAVAFARISAAWEATGSRYLPRASALTHRLATLDDVPTIGALMGRAIAELQKGFLSDTEIVASRAHMGLDTQLIRDRTYYLVEIDGRLAGCGGWSMRATLFGGDASGGRNAAMLDPAIDPARIRAMYTSPDFTRRGVGTYIIQLCEAAARTAGFRRAEMAATLSGEPLYRACGYELVEPFEAIAPGSVPVPLLRMAKNL